MHGGRVMADSQGLNRGATFTVELPSVQSTSHYKLADDNKSHVPSLANLTLLLVEDEADSREVTTLILKQQWCQDNCC